MLLATVTLSSALLFADSVNKVVVSGQVTNYEYGNPIEGHPVYIESATSNLIRNYSKTVYTDINGYYYDTISTTDNKGSLHIYTIDHTGQTVDTTLHFRFLSRASSYMIADFNIYLPFMINDLQARFNYVQKSDNSKKEFAFFDQTRSENIISWNWDFGDGSTSDIQNPYHTYESYGLYRVSLTVEAIINGEIKKSTLIKQLFLREFNFYHIGGHVFSEYFPIDKGYAYLYYIDSSSNYIALDTMAFDTLGYFYFYQIPEGNYVIKAEPMKESEYYSVLLPTYFGNTLHWQDANIIEVKNTSWEYNIALKKSMGVASGTGSISGRIEFVSGGKSHLGLFAEGVNIYLRDMNNNMLSCHYSDETGGFEFDDVIIERYQIYPEITGVTTTPLDIELTPETPVAENIQIIVTQNGISYITQENESLANFVGNPHPNPVKDLLTLPISKNGKSSFNSIKIVDNIGRIIYKKPVINLSNELEVEVSDFDNGIYTIVLSNENSTVVRKFIVAR